MADETNEIGVNVSESTDSAELFLEKHPGTSVQIISNLLKVRDRLEAELHATRATLENKILRQADQLRLQQRALVRRARTIKRQRAYLKVAKDLITEVELWDGAEVHVSTVDSNLSDSLTAYRKTIEKMSAHTKETPNGR